MEIAFPKFEYRKKLNEYQLEVLLECLEKKSGGLALPMGYGKTLLSIVLGLEQKEILKSENPVLIVVSKTLLGSWEHEINKFFFDETAIRCKFLHQDYVKNMDTFDMDFSEYDIIVTTIDVVSRYYKKGDIDKDFVKKIVINEGHFNQHIINRYDTPEKPYLVVNKGCYNLFSREWPCLIVDEVQKYANIESAKCRALGAICSTHRWALSGTIFDEPKPQKILGYYVIIGDTTFPRTIPGTIKHIKSKKYLGYQVSTVYRNRNEAHTSKGKNETIINHKMSPEEEKLYISLKDVMMSINKELKEFKNEGNVVQARKFASYLLAMLTYLRQSVICPLVPIAKACLDMSDLGCKSELSVLLIANLEKLGLKEWMNDKEATKSSRIKEIIKVVDKHKDERVILFTCFRTNLDIMKHHIDLYFPKRKTFTVTATMSSKGRKKVFDAFEETHDGILLLTYEIGGEGLNLQASHNILLTDFWWNDGKTQQTIARVERYGQTKEVNVYYFLSNTGIEQAVFDKQNDKLIVLSELRTGPQKSKVKTIKVKDIIKFIDEHDNARLMGSIRTIK